MNIVIYISQKVLISIAFLLYLLLVWRQGIRAGFNKEKIFDLALLSLAAALLTGYIFSRLGLNFWFVFFLAAWVFIRFYCRREIWSVYKIGDIFAKALFAAGIFYPYFPSPVFNLFCLVVYLFLVWLSRLKMRTGSVFLGFLVFFGPFLAALSYFPKRQLVYPDLLFALVCLLSSVLILKRKEYKDSMTLLKYALPQDVLEKIKTKLLEKKAALDSQEKNLVEEEQSLGSSAERSAEEQDQALTAGEKMKNENLLNRVEENKEEVGQALGKIESGTYGLCQKCGQPIDKARLLIFPEARFCFNCGPKEEDEEVKVNVV